MFQIKQVINGFAFLAGSLIFLVSGGSALADEGLLSPNSTACTDRTRSNNGAFIYGRFGGQEPPSRSLWMSSTPDGEAVEVSPTDPLPEGIFYFYVCVTSTSSSAASYQMAVLQNATATDYAFDIGLHTATLTPESLACGGFGTDQQRRVGTSNVPVLWTYKPSMAT
jgi:hypothetical protein